MPPLEPRKILVAVDGSNNSEYALNLSMKLATQSSTIDLIHVSSPSTPVVVSPAPPFDPTLRTPVVLPDQVVAVDEEAERRIPPVLADRKKILVEQGIQCKAIHVVSNDIAGEILRVTAEGAYDLTALGSRGIGGIRSFLMGSTSTKVARESKHSVLIAKAKIGSVPKILLGYDGGDESNIALNFTTELAKRFHAHVTVESVVVTISSEGYVGSGVERWEKEMHQLVESALSQLKSEGVEADGRVIDSPDVAISLAESAEKGDYDLIVVGNRGRGRLESFFLGSVASGIANSAKTNVLITR